MALVQLHPRSTPIARQDPDLPLFEAFDIVIVPGLGPSSDLLGEVNENDSSLKWVKEFLPIDFPHSRIFLFSYSPFSSFFHESAALLLNQNALSLLNSLIQARKTDPFRPLIFMGHSLGGFIIKQALMIAAEDIHFRTIKESARGLVSIAAFQRGSWDNSTARSFLSNHLGGVALPPTPVDKVDLISITGKALTRLPASRNALLEDLGRHLIRDYYPRLRICSFYEAIFPTIPREKAILDLIYPVETVIALNGTHRRIFDFTSSGDRNYILIRDNFSYLLDWVQQSEPERLEYSYPEHLWIKRLYPADLFTNEAKIKQPMDGTSDWILRHQSFQSLIHSWGKSFLHIIGSPGSGKSVLAFHVASSLATSERTATQRTHYTVSHNVGYRYAVSAVYLSFHSPPKSSKSVLRFLLHQIIARRPSLLRYVPAEMKMITHWEEDSDLALMCTLNRIAQHQPLFLVIDGLDECEEDIQTRLLDILSLDENIPLLELNQEASLGFIDQTTGPPKKPCLKVLITSRSEMQEWSSQIPKFTINTSQGEAARYLKHDAKLLVTSRIRHKTHRDMGLIESILDDVEGLMLWSQLASDILEPLDTKLHKRDAILLQLLGLPKTLDGLYERIYSLIECQECFENNIARKALLWVGWARRPLQCRELFDVLKADIKLRTITGNARKLMVLVAPQKTCNLHVMSTVCSSLLDITNSTVMFGHQSVKEFLRGRLLTNDQEANAALFWGCVRIILADHSGDDGWESPGSTENLRRQSALHYAACHWYDHAVTAPKTPDSGHWIHLLSNPKSRHLSSWFKTWWGQQCRFDDDIQRFPEYPTKGLVLSFLGSTEQVQRSLQRFEMQANERTCRGVEWTPLMAAAWGGHVDLVEFLLEQQEVHETRSSREMQALADAIDRGHIAVAQRLTNWFATPTIGSSLLNTRLTNGETALHCAAQSAQVWMVKWLLEAGADPNLRTTPCPDSGCSEQISTTRRSFSPLDIAISLDAFEIIDVLLQSGAIVTGRTIQRSLRRGSHSSMRKLLGRGKMVSPLCLALVMRDNQHLQDSLRSSEASRYSTSDLIQFVHNACCAEWRQGLKSFFECFPKAMDDIHVRNHLLIALHDACGAASLVFVEYLIGLGVDVNAASSGKAAIHHLLTNRTRKASAKVWSTTPVERDRIKVLRLLLDAGADPNQRIAGGDTCIHQATRNGQMQIAKLLLEGGADVDSMNDGQETALAISARSGSFEWMSLFIAGGARIGPDTWRSTLRSGSSEAVIHLAQQCSHGISTMDSRIQRKPMSCPLNSLHHTVSVLKSSEVYKYFLTCIDGDVPEIFQRGIQYLRSRRIVHHHTIQINRNADRGWSNTFKLRWEHCTGTPWNWWPLSPPVRRLSSDESFIVWTCGSYCMTQHIDFIPTVLSLEITKLLTFLQEIAVSSRSNNDVTPTRVFDSESVTLQSSMELSGCDDEESVTSGAADSRRQQSPLSSASARGSGRQQGQRTATSGQSWDTNATNQVPNQPVEPLDLNTGSVISSICATQRRNGGGQPGPIDPGDPTVNNIEERGRYVVCMPGSFTIQNLDVGDIASDAVFFERLRDIYQRSRSWKRKYFSIYRFHHWGFDKFERFQGKVRSKSRGSRKEIYLPRSPHDLNYEFTRLEIDDEPPISPALFFDGYYSCRPDCQIPRLFHWNCTERSRRNQVLDPEIGGSVEMQNTMSCRLNGACQLMKRVPKRYEAWDTASDDYDQAWGMTAFQLPNVVGFAIYSMLYFLPFYLFGVLWQGPMGHKDDLQNAWLPFGLALTIWLMVLGNMRGKGWCTSTEC